VVNGPLTVENEGDALFETLQTLYPPIQYHISENWSLSLQCCENRKTCNSELSFIDVFLTNKWKRYGFLGYYIKLYFKNLIL